MCGRELCQSRQCGGDHCVLLCRARVRAKDAGSAARRTHRRCIPIGSSGVWHHVERLRPMCLRARAPVRRVPATSATRDAAQRIGNQNRRSRHAGRIPSEAPPGHPGPCSTHIPCADRSFPVRGRAASHRGILRLGVLAAPETVSRTRSIDPSRCMVERAGRQDTVRRTQVL